MQEFSIKVVSQISDIFCTSEKDVQFSKNTTYRKIKCNWIDVSQLIPR